MQLVRQGYVQAPVEKCKYSFRQVLGQWLRRVPQNPANMIKQGATMS